MRSGEGSPCPFYLFGMGARRKMLHRAGRLTDLFTAELVAEWSAHEERVLPAKYAVRFLTRHDGVVSIVEDEDGVWIDEEGDRRFVTSGRVLLPRFGDGPEAPVLRALHQEVLINVVAGRPLPNLLVYGKPWYRDAATMLMCLAETGNLHLVEEWVAGLTEVFDRNNAGHREPDNLGQVLYIISLLGDASHPLVPRVLEAAQEFRHGRHISGLTDFAEHPAYQTKWLKHGLRALGLDDLWEIPEVEDTYSSLFWMDYRDTHVPCPRLGEDAARDYPYLAWAEAHFHGDPPPADLATDRYPLTWESNASQADYARMSAISEEYVWRRTAAPHSWHAAEAFMYHVRGRPPVAPTAPTSAP